MTRTTDEPPLLARFQALRALPRAPLGVHRTPVERSGAASALWVKRDDLNAPALGGNKVRALEFLLGDVGADDTVLTVGGRGSTHALATARHARRLGARTVVVRWPQEMNADARVVAALLEREAEVQDVGSVAAAYLRAVRHRVRGARWIPAGGATPLGALGHVNAALELAAQVEAGDLPVPTRLVVPLGTGGTAAGLAVGLAIARLPTQLIAVRVVPGIVANRPHVLRLARRAARLLERLTGGVVPRPTRERVTVLPDFYGGAYGRETAAGRGAARIFARHHDTTLDATYSAKAFAAALALAGDGKPTLFWVTFGGKGSV